MVERVLPKKFSWDLPITVFLLCLLVEIGLALGRTGVEVNSFWNPVSGAYMFSLDAWFSTVVTADSRTHIFPSAI